MPSRSLVIGCSALRTRHVVAMPLVAAATLALAGCANRSVAEFQGTLAIPPGTKTVRFEIDNGTIGLRAHTEATVAYAGGVRREGATAAALAAIEAVGLELSGAPDPKDPSVLVVRAPSVPPGTDGMLAVELGIRLPASMAVDIAIAHNGHVSAAERTGPLTAATGRGDLRFEACEGAIRARTGRGNVIAYDHDGDLDVASGSGDMQVFVKKPGDLVRLITGEGTVQCFLPPLAGFRVDARAEVGKCGSSFGIPVEHPSEFSASMAGRHGDGRTQVVMRTGKGHLALTARSFE